MKFLLIFLLLAEAGSIRAAAAGTDYKGVRQQAISLIQKGDYEGLEKLVGQIKQRGYDIRQDATELATFYDALLQVSGTGNAEWQNRLTQLQAWNSAIPESITAKIAIAKWHDETAWKARGNGFADTITLDAATIMDQQMAQATAILKAVPSANVDDPEYYHCWIEVCLLTGPDKAITQGYFEKGIAIAKEYYPLYSSMVNYLLPRWYGQQGEADNFIANAANGFPADKADVIYAYLTYDEAENTGGDFFKQSSLDYDRAKHGFFSMMGGDSLADWNKETPNREWVHENHLAFIAAYKGKDERPLLKTLFLDLEGTVLTNIFYEPGNYLMFRRRCGAQAALEQELDLERAGRMDDAEKTLLSFTSHPATYPPLAMFYERQGMKEKLAAMTIVISGTTPGGTMKLPIDQATPENLGEMCCYFPMMGEWDKAEAAAGRFDQIRPDILIGKDTLLLCAINTGDARAVQACIQSIIAMQTDRPSYQMAQEVLSGRKRWQNYRKTMDPADIYLAQGVSAMALYYVAKEESAEARSLIDFAIHRCDADDNSGTALLESMDFGSLSRSVKALAIPSPSPAASASPNPSAMPTVSGTK
jgi:hypothetical protein